MVTALPVAGPDGDGDDDDDDDDMWPFWGVVLEKRIRPKFKLITYTM